MQSYMYENKKDKSKMETKPNHITYHDHLGSPSFLTDNNGDGRSWRRVEKQLGKSQSIFLRITQ